MFSIMNSENMKKEATQKTNGNDAVNKILLSQMREKEPNAEKNMEIIKSMLREGMTQEQNKAFDDAFYQLLRTAEKVGLDRRTRGIM